MPLREYGVLIGDYAGFEVDNPSDPGRYYHGHIFVNAPSASTGTTVRFDCAVDVNQIDKSIQYIIWKNMDRRVISPVINFPKGYHRLNSNSTSGAIDYVRSKYLALPLGCATIFWFLFWLITKTKHLVWSENVGGSALKDFQELLKGPIQRVFVFGAPFNSGNGMHDIHFNQGNSEPDPNDPRFHTGDPVADNDRFNQEMGWFRNNGIWQDGIVILQENADIIHGFLVKFVVQSMKTNDLGNPIQ